MNRKLKAYTRRLELSVSGRWYLALTIGIGVVAIVTGNNAIYVIESLLLSGFILSGILSESLIRDVEVDMLRGDIFAQSDHNPDLIQITNGTRRHLFCLEIGEIDLEGRSHFNAWVPHLKPRETLFTPSTRVYRKRGRYAWKAFSIATRYPFGFARKSRFKLIEGSRLVWPSRESGTLNQELVARELKLPVGSQIREEDVRPIQLGDDERLIIWTLSSKGGEKIVRNRKGESSIQELRLQTTRLTEQEFERQITILTTLVERSDDLTEVTLTLARTQGENRYRGKKAILDALSEVALE